MVLRPSFAKLINSIHNPTHLQLYKYTLCTPLGIIEFIQLQFRLFGYLKRTQDIDLGGISPKSIFNCRCWCWNRMSSQLTYFAKKKKLTQGQGQESYILLLLCPLFRALRIDVGHICDTRILAYHTRQVLPGARHIFVQYVFFFLSICALICTWHEYQVCFLGVPLSP